MVASTSGRGRQWREVAKLAWSDFVHEWPVSLCLVLALAAVLAPLLVLFGLKSGIVVAMTERLKADPRNLEVVLRGNHRLAEEWIEDLRRRPEVGFLVPRTRSLAATLDILRPGGRSLADVDLMPTAVGDPLLKGLTHAPQGLGEVVLTHTAAARLAVAGGDDLEGVLRRRMDGDLQSLVLPLRVVGVLSESALGRNAILAALPLLVAVEDYRDGLRVPDLRVEQGMEPAAGSRGFANLRLYAATLEHVAPLAERLRSQGLEVVTSAAEIEMVQSIDRVLSFMFAVIAGVGMTGLLLSLASSLWANVDRKRPELAMLRLVGMRTGPLVAFPAAQGLMIAAGGLAVSAVLYVGVSSLFNSVLTSNLNRDEFVCRLMPGDGLAAALLTVAFALAASIAGGYRAAKIDPADSLREV